MKTSIIAAFFIIAPGSFKIIVHQFSSLGQIDCYRNSLFIKQVWCVVGHPDHYEVTAPPLLFTWRPGK